MRAFPLPVDLIQDCHDKLAAVKENYIDNSFASWDEIAFIGDDTNDLLLLEQVGMAACPLDAQPELLEFMKNGEDRWISPCIGGRGCVRWFIDLIMRGQS